MESRLPRRAAPRYGTSATSTTATKPIAEGEDEYGTIVTLKQSFGFIRCGARVDANGRESQVFFHASEFHRELANRDKPSLDPGDVVKFITAPSAKGDGQINAFNVRKCEAEEIAVKVLKSDVLGVVARTLRGKEKRDAYGGRLTYDASAANEVSSIGEGEDKHDGKPAGAEGGDEALVSVAAADADADVSGLTDPIEFVGSDLDDDCRLSKLKNGTKVKFTLLYDPFTRAVRAANIREAFPQADKKKSDDSAATQSVAGADSDNWNREKIAIEEEFGVISVVKENYGFIKCCSRSKDLFFHFSELLEDPDALCVGQEVSFRGVNEPRTGKTVAAGIRFAPKGSAVFATIDERLCRGVCKAKLIFAKGFPGKDEARGPPPTGLIVETAGKEYAFNRASLVDPRQNPHIGDLVQFCVRVDKRTSVESACKVEIMRFVGRVTSTKDGLYGFVEHVDPGTGETGKAFVHGAEIEGHTTLNVGDELEYSLQVARKENEFAAKRVKVTTSAPVDPNAPPKEKPSSDSPRPPRDSQFSGSQFQITKGPDGTRGFSLGRGAGLADKAAAIVSQLKIHAAAFVPLGSSSAKSSSISLADDVEINPDAVEDVDE